MATQPVPPESEVSAPSELPDPPDLSELDVVLDGSDDLPPGMPPGEPPDDQEGAELTLGEHLNEIRQRLTVAVLTLVLKTVITLIFASTILDYLLEPCFF
ncbi:MAG: preprotein translocase subunit TatC [Chloroflexi bacterium]|nr:preprotein translocase subunit TatC [Chloroflexota bacterium]